MTTTTTHEDRAPDLAALPRHVRLGGRARPLFVLYTWKTPLACLALGLLAGACLFLPRVGPPDGNGHVRVAAVTAPVETIKRATPTPQVLPTPPAAVPQVPVVALPPAVVPDASRPQPAVEQPDAPVPLVTAEGVPINRVRTIAMPHPAGEVIPDHSFELPDRAASGGVPDLGELGKTVDTLGMRIDTLSAALGKATPADPAPVPGAGPSPAAAPPANTAPEPIPSDPDDRKTRDNLVAALARATSAGPAKAVDDARAQLAMFDATLAAVIEFRVVDRTGEKAAFWRAPKDNPTAKQYFAVVEAVADGEVAGWAIQDADTGKVVSVRKFGLEIDETTFKRLADDKREHGSITSGSVGIKPAGRITPVWSVRTDGKTVSAL